MRFKLIIIEGSFVCLILTLVESKLNFCDSFVIPPIAIGAIGMVMFCFNIFVL
jgi:hypothetical protein